MCSACRLMVFNVCVKFHENMSSGFKVMERTRKLLTDTHTHRKDKNIIPPWHTSYAGGIKISLYYHQKLLLSRALMLYTRYQHPGSNMSVREHAYKTAFYIPQIGENKIQGAAFLKPQTCISSDKTGEITLSNIFI